MHIFSGGWRVRFMLPAHTRDQSSTTRPIARANARWRVSPRAGKVVSRAFLAVLLIGMLSAPFLPAMPVVLPEHEASAAPNLVSPTGTKMIGTGRYNVYAT